MYLEVAKNVPGAQMASISGTFLAQAYEGPYRDIPKWIADLRRRMEAKGKAFTVVAFVANFYLLYTAIQGLRYPGYRLQGLAFLIGFLLLFKFFTPDFLLRGTHAR